LKIHNITTERKQKLKSYIVLLFILMAYASCKKDKTLDKEEEIVSPRTGTRKALTLDSIFLYAKQIYLWNDVLPSYSGFTPREKYEPIYPELSALKIELFDISQLKINPITVKPYEFSNYNNTPKYSFIQIGKTAGGAVQAGFVTGEAVLSKNVVHVGDKTAAYIALGSFPSLATNKSKLDQVFAEMAIGKPKYLVLDLRFNGGGYVETAEYIANLIVPSTLNGKVMYSEQFNATLQSGNASILKHQHYLDEMGKTVMHNGHIATLADVDYSENGNTYRFDKKGNLESIEDIYVIVSGQTASASELLISCLKPYFNVKLIGEKTYGKPVGFFGINIDQYTVYLSSFLIKNALGWSDYFNGIEPDLNVTMPSNPTLGDIEEPCLKSAIAAIDGKIQLQPKKSSSTSKLNLNSNAIVLNDQSQVGMLESRLKLKQ